MAKFLITEEEKNSILNKYYPKKNLQEQPSLLAKGWKALGKLFGKSGDDIARNLSDDVGKQMDTFLGNALLKNSVVDKGVQSIVSGSSGKAIPFSTITNAVDDVLRGNKTIEQVQNQFPRFLSDATPFRDKMVELLKKQLQSQSDKRIARQQAARSQVSQVNSRFGAGSN